MCYNKAIKYLSEKYGEDFSKQSERMSTEDKHILILVNEYPYGRIVRHELKLAMSNK